VWGERLRARQAFEEENTEALQPEAEKAESDRFREALASGDIEQVRDLVSGRTTRATPVTAAGTPSR